MVAWEMLRSNSANGRAGESVETWNAFRSLKRFMMSSVGFAPCSMESTPFSRATLTPSGLSTCAATLNPSSCARSQAAFTSSGGILEHPRFADFLRVQHTSGYHQLDNVRLIPARSCPQTPRLLPVSRPRRRDEPAICPPCTETAMLEARDPRTESALPAVDFIPHERVEIGNAADGTDGGDAAHAAGFSRIPRPSSCRECRMRAFERDESCTELDAGRTVSCFGLPEPARWTCRLISPGRMYLPPRSILS